MAFAQQQKLDAAYLMQTYKRKPVEFVRGAGMRLEDDAGNEYLDFIAGIGAVSAGHANPQVTKALQEQAAKLLHVSNYYYVEGRGELAEKLSKLLNHREAALAANGAGIAPPEALTALAAVEPWRVFFANSGTEAVEGAIKLARKYGRQHLGGAATIITAQRSFHGRTLAALAATGQPSKQESFQPMMPGFVHVELNDSAALEGALDAQATHPGNAVCAVMLEVIQGEGGVWPCDEAYLKAVRELTAERGVLLIFDEVQTGFFRTGDYPFAFQEYGILPDIVTLAKGLGNGVPIGAFVAHGKPAEVLEPGDHGSTFGGSPLVVAAANATLDALSDPTSGICAGSHVSDVGAYLQAGLAALPLVAEVRGKGLMVGAQLSMPVAFEVVDAGLTVGLVLNATSADTLRFLPPLVCTKADVDTLLTRLTPLLEKQERSTHE